MTASATSRPAPLGAPGTGADVLRAVAAVVAAPSMAELTGAALDALGRAMPGAAASIDVVEEAGRRGRTLAATGVSDYFLHRYEQLGRRDDPVLREALATRRPVHSHALMSPTTWTKHPVYENVFHLHRLTRVACAPIVVDGAVVATLNVGRRSAEPAFADGELEWLEGFGAVVAAAYAGLLARRRHARLDALSAAALDLCDSAVVITDAAAGTRRLNASARRLLAHLCADGPGLDDLLGALATGADGRAALEVTLRDGSSGQLVGTLAHPAAHPGVVVAVLGLDGGATPLTAAVEAALSGRERDVVRLVVDGLRDAEIAAALGLSEHTVKQHLKAVYRKLGVRSRVALTRVALVG